MAPCLVRLATFDPRRRFYVEWLRGTIVAEEVRADKEKDESVIQVDRDANFDKMSAMAAATTRGMTYEEYVAFEEASELRHEYYNGQVFATTGGTPEHSALMAAVTVALGRIGPGPCRLHIDALRIRTPSGKAAYPDATIICGPMIRDPKDKMRLPTRP